MRKFLIILFSFWVAVLTMQAQTVTCHIDGPANVRQQADTKSAVMGSIKNGMVATVSHASGNMWKIHEVHNPRGGSAYTGKVVGYYTHKQNLVFDMDDNGYEPQSSSSSSSSSHSSGYSWMYGTWKYSSTQIKLSANNLTIYSDGQKVYSGSYEFDPGEGKEYTLVSFIPNNAVSMLIQYGRVPNYFLVNIPQKKLYFDMGKPMQKIK